MSKSAIFYILGLLVVLVLVLVGLLTANAVVNARGTAAEKPRFDLPSDIPWNRIPWKEFPEDFPYDQVPWEDLPEDTPWEQVPWEKVPWDVLPDELASKLPLESIPWDVLPDDMPWDSLPEDLPWDKIPWESVPWSELPTDFPWESVPWEELPDDFNWQAVTCEHLFTEILPYIPATCVNSGWEIYVCEKCGYSEPRETEPTGVHVYEGEWLPVNPATCVEEGLEHRVCVQCNVAEETQTISPTGVHNFDVGGKCDMCGLQQLTLRSGSATKQYDGIPLSAENYQKVFGTLQSGHSIVAVYTQLNVVSVAANVFSVTVVDDEGNDVSDKYQITYEYGALTLTKKELIVTTCNATAQFDGNALVCHDYNQTGLAEGDVLKVTFVSALTERGTCANVATVRIENSKGEDVTANYAITLVFGTLTLT